MSKEQREKEVAYHLRMASKCKKYSMDSKVKDYCLKRGKQHLEAVKKIGYQGLGIEL